MAAYLRSAPTTSGRKLGVSTNFQRAHGSIGLKVAKTSSGPFPRSFWISDAKKNNNFIKKKNQKAYFVLRSALAIIGWPFDHPHHNL